MLRQLTTLGFVFLISCNPAASVDASESQSTKESKDPEKIVSCDMQLPPNALDTVFQQATRLTISIPSTRPEQNAMLKFYNKEEELTPLTLENALDLYSRQGQLAQVSAGKFPSNEDHTSAANFTVRVFLNVQDNGQSGFVELVDNASGESQKSHASLSNCR